MKRGVVVFVPEKKGTDQRLVEVIKKSKCGKYVRVKAGVSRAAICWWVRMDECAVLRIPQVDAAPHSANQWLAEVIKNSNCGKYVKIKMSTSGDAIGGWVRAEECRFLFIPQK